MSKCQCIIQQAQLQYFLVIILANCVLSQELLYVRKFRPIVVTADALTDVSVQTCVMFFAFVIIFFALKARLLFAFMHIHPMLCQSKKVGMFCMGASKVPVNHP
jgi:hypothetical protein